MIYLDNAATTMIAPEVLEEMMPYLTTEYGNAGAIYGFGLKAAAAVRKARKQVASLIGAKPENIIFTSGGSESNSMVFQGLKQHLINCGKANILLSETEHDSVLRAAESLCIKDGFGVHFSRTNSDGTVNYVDLLDKISTKNPGLVSVMCVNNEVGAINPVHEIGNACITKNILFHTDCTQAVDTMGINVNEIGCDFLTFSSHKLHGPKGVGVLYIENKDLLNPIIFGGSVQEFGLRGGTENVAGIVGLGKACELIRLKRDNINIKLVELNKTFQDLLLKKMENVAPGIIDILYSDINHSPKIVNFQIKGVDAETLLLMLNARGICVSAGSACCSHESQPSHVLKAMGLSDAQARSSIRVSFSQYNTLEEIDEATTAIAECVKEIPELARRCENG